MGLNFDITAATPILKQRYTDKKIETLAFQGALLGLMPKKSDGGGSIYVGAIRNAVTSAVSALDTTAFTTGSSSTYQQWQCAWKYGYVSGNLTGSAIDQANGDMNSLVDAMTGEFDGAFTAAGIHAAGGLFGNGGGAIGQISSGSNTGTATITLADTSLIVNFYVGQILQTSTADGTSGAVKSGTVTVAGVDVNAGTITASGNWTAGIATAAASDFIFNQGDFGAKLVGLSGWIPDGNHRGSLSTPFNNVTRSTDPARLAGVFFGGGGAPKSESIMQSCALVGRMGGRPSHLFCNPLAFADIAKELSTRVEYATDTAYGNPQIGFDGIKIASPWGSVKVFSDPFCPVGSAWLLQMDTWLLVSIGKLPKVLGTGIDGLEWLRNAGADSYQLRVGYRATTYCSAPGWNCAILW